MLTRLGTSGRVALNGLFGQDMATQGSTLAGAQLAQPKCVARTWPPLRGTLCFGRLSALFLLLLLRGDRFWRSRTDPPDRRGTSKVCFLAERRSRKSGLSYRSAP